MQLCPLQKPTSPTSEKVQFHSWLKMLEDTLPLIGGGVILPPQALDYLFFASAPATECLQGKNYSQFYCLFNFQVDEETGPVYHTTMGLLLPK